jgi:predicted nuclease of predicted toxin-antitoxin system
MLILDAQLPPTLAVWISDTFKIDCFSATFLGLRDASDIEIFNFARQNQSIVITKDDDFVELLNRLGSPPKILWLTCGNTSKERLKVIFENHLKTSLELLKSTNLVEISGI